MEGKLITTGIDGIIVNSKAFSNAHTEWFNFWAEKLNMPELKSYVNKPQKEYWEGVQKAMKAYFGHFAKYEEAINTMARLEYQMMVLRCADQLLDNGKLILPAHQACINLLKAMKRKGHELCLVTSSPPSAVKPLLKEIDCYDLYDYIYTSKLDEKPSTKTVYERMLKDASRKKPAIHIAAGLSGIEAALKFKVTTILGMWDCGNAGYKGIKRADELAAFNAKSAIELKSQLEVLMETEA